MTKQDPRVMTRSGIIEFAKLLDAQRPALEEQTAFAKECQKMESDYLKILAQRVLSKTTLNYQKFHELSQEAKYEVMKQAFLTERDQLLPSIADDLLDELLEHTMDIEKSRFLPLLKKRRILSENEVFFPAAYITQREALHAECRALAGPEDTAAELQRLDRLSQVLMLAVDEIEASQLFEQFSITEGAIKSRTVSGPGFSLN